MRAAHLACLLLTVALVSALVLAGPATAPGSPWGWRVQSVEAGSELLSTSVATVDCRDGCPLAWESWGPSRLTLKCLDDGETVSATFPPPDGALRLSHGCIVESTLEIGGAYQSVLFWQGGRCDHKDCQGWPA